MWMALWRFSVKMAYLVSFCVILVAMVSCGGEDGEPCESFERVLENPSDPFGRGGRVESFFTPGEAGDCGSEDSPIKIEMDIDAFYNKIDDSVINGCYVNLSYVHFLTETDVMGGTIVWDGYSLGPDDLNIRILSLFPETNFFDTDNSFFTKVQDEDVLYEEAGGTMGDSYRIEIQFRVDFRPDGTCPPAGVTIAVQSKRTGDWFAKSVCFGCGWGWDWPLGTLR
ncbi:MAG: hypothetical protein RBU45_05730 [Myxococcota bacterium]|jgi:hypothetical protein|nr:hypothetical protein [Myxococcota bacterium]